MSEVPVLKAQEGPVLLTPPVATPTGLLEAAQLILLDPRKLRFFKHRGELSLTVEAQASYIRIACLRAFPLTQPTRYISLRDSARKEIGMLVDPTGLDAENRQLLDEDLQRRYMLSVIQRILAVKERFGTVEWEVQTDRGRVKFTTREIRENVLRPSPNRLVFSDVDGNRYDVPNLDALDSASQNYLLRHV